MAKTVADKLLIKPGMTVFSSDPARPVLVGPLPEGVRPADALGEVSAGGAG